jgi:hypothetical protein
MSLPFVLVTTANLGKWALSKYEKKSFVLEPWLLVRQLTMLIASIYTLLVAGSISPLLCRATASGTYVSIFDSEIQCFQGQWKSLAPVVYGFIVLYSFLYPAFLAMAFWKNRNNSIDVNFLRIYEHLTIPYKKKYFYWELVNMLKRIIFAVISQTTSLFESGKLTPYFLLIFSCFVFIGLEHIFMPYRKHSASIKSFLWTSLAIVLLLGDGLVFKSSTTPVSEKNLFSSFMIATVVVVFLIVASITFFEVGKARNKLRQTSPESAVSVQVTSSPVEINRTNS